MFTLRYCYQDVLYRFQKGNGIGRCSCRLNWISCWSHNGRFLIRTYNGSFHWFESEVVTADAFTGWAGSAAGATTEGVGGFESGLDTLGSFATWIGSAAGATAGGFGDEFASAGGFESGVVTVGAFGLCASVDDSEKIDSKSLQMSSSSSL